MANAWLEYVKKYRETHPEVPYKQCLLDCKESYKNKTPVNSPTKEKEATHAHAMQKTKKRPKPFVEVKNKPLEKVQENKVNEVNEVNEITEKVKNMQVKQETKKSRKTRMPKIIIQDDTHTRSSDNE